MQRRGGGAAALSLEVKRVIGALRGLLAAVGLEAVPAPETFRRAKFGGGPDVEDRLWQLLADILQAAGIVSCDAGARLGGAREHRTLLAAGLWQTGYHADWMCGTEGGEDGGGGLSSRRLLLALGWLLAAGTLEKLLTQRVQQLDRTLLKPTPSPRFSTGLQLDPPSLRRLQWLVGCLRHQGRTLQSMQEERTRLLHAVGLACLPSSVSSDRRSPVLEEDCVRTRQLCDLLEVYLNWKQVEKVFWTWMDSVVDCHLTDPGVEKPTRAPRGRITVCHGGNPGLEKLEEVLLRLPTGQQGPSSRDAEGRRRGGGGLQRGSGVSSLPPPVSSLPVGPSLPEVYRARLQTERPVRSSSHPAQGPCVGAGAPDELPASQAEQLLLQTEALLLERRDRRRLASRTQLQEIAGRLDELVLIPP